MGANRALTTRTYFRHFADKREVLFGGEEPLQAVFTDAIGQAPVGASVIELMAASLDAEGKALESMRGRAYPRMRNAITSSNESMQERERLKLAKLSSAVADALAARGEEHLSATYRSPSSMANGNAYDRAGRLVTCEHATSRVSRTEPDGSVVTLADRYDGNSLNSPNDVVVAADGGIYFTDPTFGRNAFFGVPREPELPFQGVYRISPDGGVDLLVDDFAQPNGLCFSLDGKQLFVNDTERRHIRVFPVSPDGRLGEGSVWADVGGEGDGVPDGMKIDSAGNLYCTGPGGVHVFDPDGTCLGVLRIPEVTANFTWGDEDLRTIFVCASTSLYRIAVEVPGVPCF